MKVVMLGSKPERITREELKRAVNFFASRLLSPRLSNNILTYVKLRKNLMKRDNVFAWCCPIDDHLRPREFEIELDASLPRLTTIRTLAHEMVHVRQWAKDELKDYVTKDTHWHGSPVSPDTPYRERPWEVEAYAMQNKLASEYFAWNRDQKKFHKGVDK